MADRQRSRGRRDLLILSAICLLPFLLVLGLLRVMLVASFHIPSGAMEPTLRPGDLLWADRLDYSLLKREPARGQIVVFRYPESKPGAERVLYIKRCIGLPGEVIEIRGGLVYVDGAALTENYIAEPPNAEYGPVSVPADSYFVLGDNRNYSSDSRVWGFVPRANLVARALSIYWPPGRSRRL